MNFSPCLFPCDSGLSSILRVAGLLRPVSICMAVGSGRRPFPLFTALEGGVHKTSNQYKRKLAANFGHVNVVSLAPIPWFGQQSEQPTCFFQEGQGHRRTPWCVSQPAACHQWVAVLPQPSQLWQTPKPQTAENFHLVPEPTVEGGEKKLWISHTRLVLMPINTVHTRLSDRPVVTAWTPNVRVTSKSTFMFKMPCKNPWNVPEFLLKINLKSCWKLPNRKSCV